MACGDGRGKGDAAGDVRGGRPRGQAGGALGGRADVARREATRTTRMKRGRPMQS
ncbi:hypothetical protein DO71_5185 [Burkholderia pseudomallei]|nr:hypothetical protein DO71_5185 [Burkholderia pseudomallei]